MFDNLKGMAGLAGIMKDLPKIKAKMEEVKQEKPLNMGWCLDCHRKPLGRVRDPLTVTDLGWRFEDDSAAKDQFGTLEKYSEFWLKHNNISPSQDCSTCHR